MNFTTILILLQFVVTISVKLHLVCLWQLHVKATLPLDESVQCIAA